ncbi:aryl-alcohol-oxidase from pleurotus Eryingii [Mucidula mucida]|nr:aryl-alcohol-oxidase from pleurotus Eryingii [Mucidula mucida]
MVLLRSLWFVAPAWAALYTSPKDLPDTTFDFVVVGAGAAGSVVANRLTEDSNVTVLVLEAGVTNENVTASIIPLLGPSLVPDTVFDYNYTTVPIEGYFNRTLPYARGRMLGGSTSVSKGSKDDYDRYAKYSGDDGWSWDSMQKYIDRHETFITPSDRREQFAANAHGTNGILQVSLPATATVLDQRVLDTTEELKDEFPFNTDPNDGSVLGVAWSQATIDGNNARSSAATAYLGPDYISRSNLHVLIGATATKLVQTDTVDDLPSFHKVEYKTDSQGATSSVSATKEIILSGGSINTPMLLMLSGIGDKDELKDLGISTVVNNPSVGKNLTDHPLLASVYSVQGTDSFDDVFRGDNLEKAIGEWMQNGTGALGDGVCNHLAFLRLPDNSSIFDGMEDPAAGPNAAHIEFIVSNLWVQPGIPAPETGSFMTLTTTVISPTSRGWMKLANDDPFGKPLINPNYLSTEWDVFALRESIKSIQRFVNASAWDDYVIGPFGQFAEATTDDGIDTYMRNNSATFFHPISTAMMSPKGASWGVVDPDLKVKGVEGLRIVDGSVLPYLPNAHTQGPIYLFAERGADLIKAGSSGNASSDASDTDAAYKVSFPAFTTALTILTLTMLY